MRKFIIGAVIALVIVGVAGGLYIYFSGGSGEASQPISSEQLEAESTEQIVFRIVPEESSARFTLNEELNGRPVTVVAQTNQVAGDILVDFASPTASTVGMIRVNVRTMQTDSSLRDRAIRGQILQSAQDAYEFAEFTPTALEGLPESVTLGEPFDFEIVGNLKVRDITQEVRFTATVTPVSETRLEGSAAASVQRADYQLIIPSVPSVANVSEDVGVFIDFVALAVTDEAQSS